MTPKTEANATASGLATRLENLYTGLDDTRAQLVADIASYRREVEVNAPRIDAPFARAEGINPSENRFSFKVKATSKIYKHPPQLLKSDFQLITHSNQTPTPTNQTFPIHPQ